MDFLERDPGASDTRVWALLVVALLVLAPSAQSDWSDFPVLVWRQEYRGRALPSELIEPFRGTNLERDESADWVFEQELDFYVGHAPGRNQLHLDRTPDYQEWFESWYRTRDPLLNVREPCLTAEQTRADLFSQLERSLRARAGRYGLGISLGDEVSLTPWGDPLDICRSPTCEEAWREWCGREGLELGAASTTDASSTDAPTTAAPTTDELRLEIANGSYRSLGLWLARRRFHQQVVLELLKDLARRSRELLPGAPVGLLGMSGQTAFGGVAIDRALEFLDFIEAYPVDDARELMFTALRPDQRVLATVFAEDDASGSANGVVLRVWEQVLRGGDGIVLWSDRTLAKRPEWRRRIARAMLDVRGVRDRVPELSSHRWARPSGVAILHSPDSLAFSWMRDALLDGPTWPNRLAGNQRDFGTRDRSLKAWLRLIEDSGRLPGAIGFESLEAATVDRFPLLVLSHVSILEPTELLRLESYLDAGGQVVVEGPLGVFDRAGIRPPESPLKQLESRFPQRVHESPARLVEYGALRLKAGNARASQLRRSIDRMIEPADSRSLFRIAGGKLPWLTEVLPLENDGWLCMALPNATTPEQRAGLTELEVQIQVQLQAGSASEMELEWIHPPVGEGLTNRLPAGDALVFRLRVR